MFAVAINHVGLEEERVDSRANINTQTNLDSINWIPCHVRNCPIRSDQLDSKERPCLGADEESECKSLHCCSSVWVT